MAESFSEKEIVNYPNGGKSIFYTSGQTAVIIDEGICRRDSEEDIFPYTLITDKQNEYMHRYDKVFRFLAEDRDQIDHVIKGIQRNVDFVLRVPNREDNAEASPLEFRFEQNFTNVYGNNALVCSSDLPLWSTRGPEARASTSTMESGRRNETGHQTFKNDSALP